MKVTIILGLILLVIVLAVLAAGGIWLYRDDRRLAAKYPIAVREKESPSEPDWEWLHVTAGQLVADYRSNEIAADLKYKNQHLIVTGTLGRITSEFLTLEVEDALADVQCIYASQGYGSEGLQRGRETRIFGTGGGKLHNVILTNCRPG
jgi:hypothetical protein